MDSTLFVIQILNGLQLGVLLFLLAAGLTLVFGIMDFINLAHGSFYMIGAFFCATLTLWLDSFLLAALLALPLTLVVGVVVELLVVRHLYQEDHLQQILATFGLILTILGTVRHRPDWVAPSVALYITAAYWFTSSTSFANPAVTIARGFSDTFAGIAPADVAAFIAVQLIAAVLATGFFGWLLKHQSDS